MARRGQTLLNPASGERITFRTTAAETNGEAAASMKGRFAGGSSSALGGD